MNIIALIFLIVICLLVGLLLGAWSTRQRKTGNKDAAWNEARCYYTQVNPFNRPAQQAFTRHGINEAGARAVRNPEDFSG